MSDEKDDRLEKALEKLKEMEADLKDHVLFGKCGAAQGTRDLIMLGGISNVIKILEDNA